MLNFNEQDMDTMNPDDITIKRIVNDKAYCFKIHGKFCLSKKQLTNQIVIEAIEPIFEEFYQLFIQGKANNFVKDLMYQNKQYRLKITHRPPFLCISQLVVIVYITIHNDSCEFCLNPQTYDDYKYILIFPNTYRDSNITQQQKNLIRQHQIDFLLQNPFLTDITNLANNPMYIKYMTDKMRFNEKQSYK